ncbi:MAG: spore cortex-lytic enzyme [Ruminococcaceae bacterium]|nr:spore cortex-lytic enzyme [Oscillospiraceae bacterium]
MKKSIVYTRYRALLSFMLALTVLIFAIYAQRESEESVYTLSKIGSRGNEVRQIQKKLKELGYYKGSIDGIYGTGTQKAVKSFQKNCGITADGIAGPKTLKYLGLSASSGSSGAFSGSDINLLAKLIAAEARGESYTGQVAVGAVVLNRVSHPSFPDTVAGVIYQKGAFSCVNDSNWSVSPNATSLKAARDCINGWDPSGGAIYYYNPAKTSNSFMHSRPVITTIGRHVFCR